MTLADLDLALEAIIPGVYRTLKITLTRKTYPIAGRTMGLTFHAQVFFLSEPTRSTLFPPTPEALLNEIQAWADARNRPPSTEADIAKVGELAAPVKP